MEEKIETIMQLITDQATDLDQDQLWEFYSMLSFRCRSMADDLEDQELEKDQSL